MKQLLYYLSEENLQRDEFFFKEVSSNPEHSVKIDLFLKCNKVKKLGVINAKQLIEGIAGCEDLELNPEKTAIRAKGLDKLPEFQPKKKVKSEDHGAQKNPFDKLEV